MTQGTTRSRTLLKNQLTACMIITPLSNSLFRMPGIKVHPYSQKSHNRTVRFTQSSPSSTVHVMEHLHCLQCATSIVWFRFNAARSAGICSVTSAARSSRQVPSHALGCRRRYTFVTAAYMATSGVKQTTISIVSAYCTAPTGHNQERCRG